MNTPYYEYDLPLLQRTLQVINESIGTAPYSVHYALKANANPIVLAPIRDAGLGVDCVSGGEIQRALDCGFAAEKIVFAGVGKADWEIRLALEAGIEMFNVESIPELEVINTLASEMDKTARIAFRINPNVDAHTHAKITTGLNENKFGLAMSDMIPAIHLAERMNNVEYVGLHFHIGSQITEMFPFEALAERINELQDELEKAGITSTKSINVGGGLGIDYQNPETNSIPDFNGYFETFKNTLKLREGQQVHCELGRSVVAQCGRLVTEVLYVKQGHQKQFVIVDAGMTDLVRPAMYGSFHKCITIENTSQEEETYDIVGPICESSDVFLSNYTMPKVKRGDRVAFLSAGAYGEIMASQYNCRRLPDSIVAK